MPFWGWSKTPASNANSDPTVNWAEGMAPSAVNDSARAMAARLAEWRDDISGTITTGGTGTAYTIASNQVFDTLTHINGAMIAFVPHATNGATVTLNVDGLGAKPLRTSTGAELAAGMLIAGTPYVATYNNSDGVFYLQSFFGNPYNIPIGGLMPYVGSTPPNSSFVFPFGQAISRTGFPTLFSLTGTTFGAGDGSTTFNIIDLRGRIPVGVDNMGGSAASRIGTLPTDGGTIVGTTLGSTGGSQSHVQTSSELVNHTHANSLNDPGHSHTVQAENSAASNGFLTRSSGLSGNFSTSTNTTGITIANAAAGSSAAMAWLQPSIMANYILRVI
jgi:microcystin-dependent protein